MRSSLHRAASLGGLSNATDHSTKVRLPSAIFYFAFLPQFVLPGAPHPTAAIFVLGLLFAALTFLVKGPVGYFAGLLSGWLRSRPRFLVWLYRSSGAVLLGLGVKLAFDRRT